jgi:branched-chain amino acid transport system permease protein
MIFWFLFELLDGIMTAAVVEAWFWPFTLLDSTDIGPIRFALFGIGLMWLMAFRPQGLFGKREEMLIDAR